jgi:quercetin dioxygenase-like cupin family protein
MEKSSLTALVREQLELARGASSGRSAKTIYGGHERVLRQTVIALATGQLLDEHDNPGEATLQVLHGRIRLATDNASWDGMTGDFLVVPDARHSLEAVSEAAVLLTVAMRVPA